MTTYSAVMPVQVNSAGVLTHVLLFSGEHSPGIPLLGCTSPFLVEIPVDFDPAVAIHELQEHMPQVEDRIQYELIDGPTVTDDGNLYVYTVELPPHFFSNSGEHRRLCTSHSVEKLGRLLAVTNPRSLAAYAYRAVIGRAWAQTALPAFS